MCSAQEPSSANCFLGVLGFALPEGKMLRNDQGKGTFKKQKQNH